MSDEVHAKRSIPSHPIPSSPFSLIQPTSKLNSSRDSLRTPASALPPWHLVPLYPSSGKPPIDRVIARERARNLSSPSKRTRHTKKTPTNQPFNPQPLLLPQQSNLSIDFLTFSSSSSSFFLLRAPSRPTCSALPSSAHPPRPSAPLLPDPPPSEQRP